MLTKSSQVLFAIKQMCDRCEKGLLIEQQEEGKDQRGCYLKRIQEGGCLETQILFQMVAIIEKIEENGEIKENKQ